MNNFEKGGIATGLAIFLVAVLSLPQSHSDPEVDLVLPQPPPVERVYTPSEATVEVSAYFDGQRAYGRGIVVRHNDQMFVLTSSMISSEKTDSIIVGGEYVAEVLHQNNIWGLLALDCFIGAGTPFVELNDDPNIPPLVQVGVNGWPASTLEYINDDWVLLGDIPEEDCTGCPVTQNGYVVGIVVGINRINRDQAIMVGNRALKAFCDEATLMNAPLPLAPGIIPMNERRL